ncbi:hypothetical protein BREVNS_0676 [Brevinematales bacterium NS]|nr:hypothetical protein [Brevinematales bacterium]QJR21426.1 hypothetical protein BREVNS_0676 [Brevinematales bacterium NS]
MKQRWMIFGLWLPLWMYGLILPEGTDAMVKNVQTYPQGKIKSVRLLSPTWLNTRVGKFLFTGDVSFYENGHISNGTVVSDADKAYEPSSELKSLGKFGTILAKLFENPGGKISFFPDGLPQEVRFSSSLEVDESSLSVKAVGFYKGGGVMWAEIEFSFEEEEKVIERDDDYWGPEERYTERIYYAEFVDTPLGEFSARKVYFYPDGTLRAVDLTTALWAKSTFKGYNTRFSAPDDQQVKTPLGSCYASSLGFYPDGKMRYVEMTEEIAVQTPLGIVSVAGLLFYPDSSLWAFYVASKQGLSVSTSLGKVAARGVFFYPGGKLHVIELASPLTVGKTTYKKGDAIAFDQAGKFLGRVVWDSDKGEWVKPK